MAEKVIAHTLANGGRCRHGFLKELLAESDAEQAAAGLEFDSDESDSGNEARSDDEGE